MEELRSSTAYLIMGLDTKATPPTVTGVSICSESSPTGHLSIRTFCLAEAKGIGYEAASRRLVEECSADLSLAWAIKLLKKEPNKKVEELTPYQHLNDFMAKVWVALGGLGDPGTKAPEQILAPATEAGKCLNIVSHGGYNVSTLGNPTTLRDWAVAVHKVAKSKGWWDSPGPGDKSFGDVTSLFHTEVSEAYEEYRNGHGFTEVYYKGDNKPEGIPIELADVLIRVLDFCARYDIDIQAAVERKHAYNQGREWRHGGKVT